LYRYGADVRKDTGVTERTMRAAVVPAFGTISVVDDWPVPAPGPDEVLLKVLACGVDRFDVDIAAGKRSWAQPPLVLGHEIAGEVVDVGSDVRSWHVGHRVVPSLYLVCGECVRCREGRETICQNFRGHIGLDVAGGYAEYVVVPARNLVRLPDEIDWSQGTLLANVVGTGVHALRARMQLAEGERIIITGAGGGVGLHAIQTARSLGADVMAVDVSDRRLAKAVELGASMTCRGDRESIRDAAMEWTDGVGVDGVLELVGPATMDGTLNSLRRGGRLVIVGSHSGSTWSVDPHVFYRHEWEIRGSRNVSVREVVDAVQLVLEGEVVPVIDRKLALGEVRVAFERLESGAVMGRDVLIP
jgi:D-arabinose 1-dehydrogenase-like Zn-dependent alcohol dehydrogenase